MPTSTPSQIKRISPSFSLFLPIIFNPPQRTYLIISFFQPHSQQIPLLPQLNILFLTFLQLIRTLKQHISHLSNFLRQYLIIFILTAQFLGFGLQCCILSFQQDYLFGGVRVIYDISVALSEQIVLVVGYVLFQFEDVTLEVCFLFV